MDPLSDLLLLLKPRNYMFGGFDFGGDWSVCFEKHEGIKCYALVSGQCWLKMEGVLEPVNLKAGDCILLPSGRAFQLASDLSLPPVDPRTLYDRSPNGAMYSVNGGGSCFSIGGHFAFAGKHADLLLSALPPIVHLRKDSARAAMRWSIEQLMAELREPEPGGFLVAQQLATTMLVHALRLHLAEGFAGGVGWLFALADKQMRIAITCMHEEPARCWTVEELARRAGMSRATFAYAFKRKVGVGPITHLTRWRMFLGADRLLNSSESIASISFTLGYESESAFSTAFKRVMGCSPRGYSRKQAVHLRNPLTI